MLSCNLGNNKDTVTIFGTEIIHQNNAGTDTNKQPLQLLFEKKYVMTYLGRTSNSFLYSLYPQQKTALSLIYGKIVVFFVRLFCYQSMVNKDYY